MKYTAIVTGANRGLGFATAQALVQKGYEVIFACRDPKKIKELPPSNAHAYRLDVFDLTSIEAFAFDVLKKFPRIDVLVNNAGVFEDTGGAVGEQIAPDGVAALGTKADTILHSFRINTLAPFILCQKFLPLMLKNKYGRIVNVSSGMGQLDAMDGGYAAYRISKTALNAVTKMLSVETQGRNILINSVCPGWVRTDMGTENAPRSIAEGILGIVWAATLEDRGPTGGFFRDGKALPW